MDNVGNISDGQRKEVKYDTEHTIACYGETKREYLLNKVREERPLFHRR